MKAVAETLGVSRSNLHERLKGTSKPRRGYHKAQDAALLPRIRALVAKRPTYGYRRMTAVLNRDLQAGGLDPVIHKRVYRIMKASNLLLERSGFERCERAHDGKVVMMRSNLRWCSDGLEFACWNGDVIRAAFLIDAHDREIIAWRAVVNAGISGSDVRDMLLEAVEKRFGACRATDRRNPVRKWQRLYGEGSAHLRSPAGHEVVLYAGQEPAIKRYVGGFRQNIQARLCPRQSAA
ncbi:MAG: hypothetical protein MnENMB40S_37310 [Rhizobiaceae bacterium MnEN-MB40S]|nr:MAG: hypothetical protein MnENMB40S_37310 [Rhizobiaceae bacterium MnEN-MB40S]